jgi:hypothetical protein
MANHVNTHVRFEKLNDAGKVTSSVLIVRPAVSTNGIFRTSDRSGVTSKIAAKITSTQFLLGVFRKQD